MNGNGGLGKSVKDFLNYVGVAALLVVFLVFLFSVIGEVPRREPGIGSNFTGVPIPLSSDLKTFKSWNDVSLFLESASSSMGGYGYGYSEGIVKAVGGAPMPGLASADTSAGRGEEAPDYSTTNVQVEGVDEPDVMKNDGRFIYTVSGGDIAIVKAYPAGEASLVSVINGSFTGMFIYGDRLIAFGSEDFVTIFENDLEELPVAGAEPAQKRVFTVQPRPSFYGSVVEVYDIADRTAPKLLKEFELPGNYVDARMIDGRVYVIYSFPAYYGVRPLYAVDGEVQRIDADEIGYFDVPCDCYYGSYEFTTILGFDASDLGKEPARKTILMSSGAQNLFVSRENAYITYTSYARYYPWWDAFREVVVDLPQNVSESIAEIDALDIAEWRKDNLKMNEVASYVDSLSEVESNRFYEDMGKKIQELTEKRASEREKTVVHKLVLGDAILYGGEGSVPGHVLNQFSMDESEGYFRIATTVGQVWRVATENPSKNNVYVLNSSLGVVGSLEDLAPGEKIYSARFMGKRAFLVTFRKVDPLFVIDLSDPTAPKLLGKLKIPGYSDYLHPYDENHLIGLGKDAIPAEEGDFSWYQGVKLSLFDVSDLANPKELSTYVIGDRGTDSYALQDHKAFLFSKDKNLLVIPILLAEIDESKYPQGTDPSQYGDYVFQGAYVFGITPETGFALRGTISHADEEAFRKSGEYYWGYGTNVERSAYIGETLYTISQQFVKANDLSTLEEKASVRLPYVEEQYYPETLWG